MSTRMKALPLEGIRVVDLTTVLMGPYATQLLADWGADVIKVEPPSGDPVRGIGPMRHPQMGAIFLNANRNKRSVVLDLRHPEARSALRELLRGADVLAYNLRPHDMAGLGLSYEDVRALNPRIVYLGMFGFARATPACERAAYDDLIQGMTGLAALTLDAGSPQPRYVPLALADRVAGLAGANALLLALLHRERTGEGQMVDATMFETMASFVLADHLAGEGFVPAQGPMRYQRLLSPDRRPYRTRDGWICVMVYSDRQWRDFFRAIGRDDEFAAHPEWADITGRSRTIDALYGMVSAVLQERSTADWLELFARADVPAAPMLSLEEVLAQLAGTPVLMEAEHATEGRIRMVGDGIAASAMAKRLRSLAPGLGEHSAEILRSIGRSDEQIRELAARGVTRLATTPDEPATRT